MEGGNRGFSQFSGLRCACVGLGLGVLGAGDQPLPLFGVVLGPLVMSGL